MLDIKSQSQLAEATADMMRACALATARAAGTSVFQGMSFWSRMLRPSMPAFAAERTAQMQEALPQATAEPPADAAFSSYRSSSGHAVAQIVVPDATP